MTAAGGTFEVPVEINGAITLNFVIDSGAADVTIPADVVSTLIRMGTIKPSDFIGRQTYVLADGSESPSSIIGHRLQIRQACRSQRARSVCRTHIGDRHPRLHGLLDQPDLLGDRPTASALNRGNHFNTAGGPFRSEGIVVIMAYAYALLSYATRPVKTGCVPPTKSGSPSRRWRWFQVKRHRLGRNLELRDPGSFHSRKAKSDHQ
jgi:Aspartyl protease